jgi:hypothetical protein
MRKPLICKHLLIPLAVAFMVSIVPAEATRRHSIRPQVVAPPGVVAEDATVSKPAASAASAGEPVADGAAGEKPAHEEKKVSKVPRRGLLEILFGTAAADALARESAVPLMDERMFDAVRLAERSARSHSIHRCWRYVKRALQKAGVVECYPRTAFAKQAAVELPERYGFKEIDVSDPFEAPVGAVLVYGGRGAGHVELRTEHGFVSDHASLKPSPRPLIGVFIKPIEG